MRARTKHRCYVCIWALFTAFAFWWFLSASRRTSRLGRRLPRIVPLDEVPLKLFVVEEHQEVLLPWTDAFIHGIMPPNSTLIHIDAHPDDGLPNITPFFPKFKPPRSEEEVSHMIQANDRFIRAAQLTHMLSRLVWIYPSWTKEDPYTDSVVHLGFTVFRGRKAFCECLNDGNATYSCSVLDEESNTDDIMTKIPSRLCMIRRRFRSEVIRDVYALTHQASESWLSNDNLVLDIDEDFFGVHLVGSRLIGSGMRWSDVKVISGIVKRMFCPKDAIHEKMADRWFCSFVDAIRDKCHIGQSSEKWCDDARAAVAKFFMSFRSDKRFSQMFCQTEKSAAVDFTAKRAFIKMWKIIRGLTRTQQLEVRRTGICFVESIRTMDTPRLHLCIGHNSPNDTAVAEHYPSPTELTQLLDRLRTILELLPHRPRLITLARSSRDGYVPRDLQADIEQRIIAILRDVFKVKDEDIIFDELLLNGAKGGWFGRSYTN